MHICRYNKEENTNVLWIQNIQIKKFQTMRILLLKKVLIYLCIIVGHHCVSIDFHKSYFRPMNSALHIGEIVLYPQTIPYQLQLMHLQRTWSSNLQFLFIPTQFVAQNQAKTYTIIVKLNHQSVSLELQADVIIKNGKLYFSKPDQTAKNSSVDGKKIVESMQKKQGLEGSHSQQKQSLSNVSSPNNQVIEQVINGNGIRKKPKTQGQPPAAKFNQKQLQKKIKQIIITATNAQNDNEKQQLFAGLPNLAQMSQIVSNSESLKISQTIQLVTMSSMGCEQKIAYLLQFSGIINQQIQSLKPMLKKLQIVSNISQQQIQQLQQEYVQMGQQLKNLDIGKINEEMNIKIREINDNYQKHNQIMGYMTHIRKSVEQTIPNNIKIYEQKIIQSKTTEEQLHQQIKQFNLKFKGIEQEYQKAQSEKRLMQQKYSEAKERTEQLSQYSEQQKVKLGDMIQKLRNYERAIDKLKIGYKEDEIEVGRIRENLRDALVKYTRISQKMTQMKEEIIKKQQNLNKIQIISLQSKITLLSRNLPNINQELDRIYYKCYKVDDIHIQPKDLATDNQLFGKAYSLSFNQFEKYLATAYGPIQLQQSQILKQNPHKQDMHIQTTTIFDPVWINKYGKNTTNGQNNSAQEQKSQKKQGIIDESSVSVNENIMKNDFTCLEPSAVKSNSGIIKYIEQNIIVAMTDQNQLFYLRMGSCSRMEAIGSDIPQIGQRIFWKGKPELSGYNIYSASAL